MTGSEYQKLAMRTNDGKALERLILAAATNREDVGGILEATFGLVGEVGELDDMIKKWIFHERPLNVEHAKRELGDALWYAAMICHCFGWDMDEIMQINIDKLKVRFPEGFTPEAANNRAAGDL